MATVDWPADLPDPEVSSWALEPAPLTIRSEMEAGPARVRRISQQRNDTIAASWVFSRAQFGQFRAWFILQAQHGAAWFNVDLFAGRSGADLGKCQVTEEARFIGQWKASALSNQYIRVTAELEVR